MFKYLYIFTTVREHFSSVVSHVINCGPNYRGSINAPPATQLDRNTHVPEVR